MPKTRAKAPRKQPTGGRSASAGPRLAGPRPALSGFVYGVVVGVVVTLAFGYLPDSLPSVDNPLTDSGDETASVPTVDFEFMYRLPKERVVTNVEPYPVRTSDAAAPTVPADDPTKEYLLQAAAFRGRDDADAMRARLILATNMGAKIESARDPDGLTWHRVLVGPFESRVDMQRTLTALQGMDVSAVPLERPKG